MIIDMPFSKPEPLSISSFIEKYFTTGTDVSKLQIHFVGIGGIGISALARWFLSYKSQTSGCDRSRSPLIDDLIHEGLKFFNDHDKSHVSPKTDLVVYSNAVPAENPEIIHARQLGIPVASYPEVIGELTRHYKTIAVAGMHGKSTTTGMIASIFICAGLDPTVIVGVKLAILGGKNFRRGKSEYLILEADEYAKAFLHYTPSVCVVTNLDAEHLEIYGTMANIKKSFLKYFAQTTPGGMLILNADNSHLTSQRNQIETLARKNDLRVVWYGNKNIAKTGIAPYVQIPGAHNLQNAHASCCAAIACGVSPFHIYDGLKKYKGAWRRMERRGKLNKSLCGHANALVFDDYAHHPTEISATLKAFDQMYPKAKILCVFQPHQSKRLSLLFKEFISAFGAADALILLPAYIVPGRDSIDPRYNSQTLLARIKNKEPKKYLHYEPNPEDVPGAISRAIESMEVPEVVVVMMGAGPIVNITACLL